MSRSELFIAISKLHSFIKNDEKSTTGLAQIKNRAIIQCTMGDQEHERLEAFSPEIWLSREQARHILGVGIYPLRGVGEVGLSGVVVVAAKIQKTFKIPLDIESVIDRALALCDTVDPHRTETLRQHLGGLPSPDRSSTQA